MNTKNFPLYLIILSPQIENEVFEFKCSTGLLFDIVRQICDFKAKVDNCDVNTGLSAFQFISCN